MKYQFSYYLNSPEKVRKICEFRDIPKKWIFHVLNTHEKKPCCCDPIIINKMEKLLQILVCLWWLWPFRWELYNTLWLGLCVSSSYQHLCILLYLLSISRFSTTGQWTWIMKYFNFKMYFFIPVIQFSTLHYITNECSIVQLILHYITNECSIVQLLI